MGVSDSKLVDKLHRPLKDLRISVIDKCNFRCTYCMPSDIFGPDYPFLPQDQLLSFAEIVRLTKLFVELGVEKIRLTGGEPLLRKDLPDLVRQIDEIEGVKDIALTTNGVLLPKYAKALKDAGLQRISVSLDALDDEVFGKMNGRNVKVNAVLKGIEAAQEAGLGVKVNTVLKKGLNDDQILPLARYFKEKGIIIRFIEFMDVGNTNDWNMESVVTKKQVYEAIHEEMPLETLEPNYFGEVATRYRYQDSGVEVGFISSVTEAFCSSCTRARLSADGKIYTCLFASEGSDIRQLVRSGATDEKLFDYMKKIWHVRHDRYSEERTEGTNKRKKIEMSYIGG